MAIIAAQSVGATASAAVVTQWVSNGGGEFSDDANWDLGTPGPATLALFAIPGPQEILVDIESSVLRLVVRSGAATFHSETTLTAHSDLASAPSLVVADTNGGVAGATISSGTIVGTFAEMGAVPGSAGSLTVLPGGMVALSDVLSIGPRGTGTLEVSGGRVECRRLLAGTLAGASGSVTIHGPIDGEPATGLLDAGESIILGQKGLGTMTVELEGGAVADELVVALGPLSSGELRVEGPGTTLTIAGSADIGRNGQGGLHVLGGATAAIGGTTTVGTLPDAFVFPFHPGGSGLVRVEGSGSLLAVGGALECPLSGTSQLELVAGGRVTVAGDLGINRPNQSSMLFEVGLPTGGPSIEVAGSALAPLDPDGELAIVVLLADGYVPTAGDTHVLIEASMIDLPYEASLPAIEPPLRWVLLEEPASAAERLVLRATIPADLDGDGEVSGADLGLLLAASGGSDPLADLDGNGAVDGGDLGLLLADWGPIP